MPGGFGSDVGTLGRCDVATRAKTAVVFLRRRRGLIGRFVSVLDPNR